MPNGVSSSTSRSRTRTSGNNWWEKPGRSSYDPCPNRRRDTQPPSAPTLRLLTPHDDLERLTALIHSAYAPHAAKGLRYWATHQTVEDTAKRLASGLALVMEIEGDYAATATLRAPQPDSKVALYRDSTVWSITQFCVAPRFKGLGLGKLLHGELVERARNAGAATLALDTAQPAHALIAMYESWGYRVVGECDWRPLTNYTSVLMSRPVGRATA